MKRKRIVFLFILFILSVGVFLITSSGKTKVQITAHRGNQAVAPENTIPAFQAAIEYGADYIELDTAETKDGVLVVFHDDNLKRITGYDKNIWEVTYEELSQMDAGSYKAPEFAGTRIPALLEVVKLCKGKIDLNIELKYNGHESESFLQKVNDLIVQEDLENECVVTSFHYEFISQLKSLNSDIKTGYIFSEKPDSLKKFTDADLFSVRYNVLDKELVSEIHDMGKTVHVWTVNENADMRRCKKLKVDNMITNDVGTARKILGR